MNSITLVSTGSGIFGGIITIVHTENFIESCLFSAVFAAIGYMTKLGIDLIRKKIFKNKNTNEDRN
jgi:hypothetical protein